MPLVAGLLFVVGAVVADAVAVVAAAVVVVGGVAVVFVHGIIILIAQDFNLILNAIVVQHVLLISYLMDLL